jgi:hypothetical protein
MGTLHRIPQAQLDETQRILRAEMMVRRPELANIGPAAATHDTGWVEYRSRRYRVPPIPYRLGLVLEALGEAIRRVTPNDEATASPDQYAALLDLIRDLLLTMARCVRPRWWPAGRWATRLWHALTWERWRPFDDAEADEVAALLGFFAERRTSSPVRASTSTRALPRYRRTWPTNSPPSRARIPRGWMAVSRAVGRISSLAPMPSPTTRSAR